jgi:hypothetical protein
MLLNCSVVSLNLIVCAVELVCGICIAYVYLLMKKLVSC